MSEHFSGNQLYNNFGFLNEILVEQDLKGASDGFCPVRSRFEVKETLLIVSSHVLLLGPVLREIKQK